MKKILTSLALLGLVAFNASAQRTTGVKCVWVGPQQPNETTAFTIPCSDSFTIEFIYINEGPEVVLTTDTFFYIAPFTPDERVNYVLTTTPVAVNDTITRVAARVHRNQLRLVDLTSNDWLFPPHANGTYGMFTQCAGFTNTNTPPANFLELDEDSEFADGIGVSIDCTTSSVADVKLNKQTLSVYPNPVLDKVNFKFNLSNGNATARILDIAGRSVMVKDFGKQNAGEKELSIDVSSLNAGMYYVELVNGENRAISKITVQK